LLERLKELGVNFATFTDGGYAFRAAGKRLSKQAKTSGLFHNISQWDMNEINKCDPMFLEKHSAYIKENPRGMGNYIWKPKVFLEELNRMNPDDFLVMIDAGCQLNLSKRAVLRFQEYLESAHQSGGVFMQLTDGAFGIDDLSDSAWTKLSLLNYLDPDSIHRKTGQVQSGIIIVQKQQKVIEFADQWMNVCQLDEKYFLKTPEVFEEQSHSYQSHRWEQSVLSLLVKQSGFTLIKDETFFAPNWKTGDNFPIWAMRNRSGGDAYRRNFLDLTKIALAKFSREFYDTNLRK
jgi:hypothetical protein